MNWMGQAQADYVKQNHHDHHEYHNSEANDTIVHLVREAVDQLQFTFTCCGRDTQRGHKDWLRPELWRDK